jgi:hypothetical protein
VAKQPGYRGVYTGSAPGGTNVSVALPSTTKNGDLLVVLGAVDYGPASNPKGAPSSGGVTEWTVHQVGFDTTSNGLHSVIATMRSTQDGARNVVFPNPSSAQADCAYIVAVVDGTTVDPNNPVTVPADVEYATSGTSLTAPAVTPGADQSLVLWCFATRTGSTTATIFTTTGSKLVERGSRTYVTAAMYGVYLTSAATRAAFTVSASGGAAAVRTAATIVVNGAPDPTPQNPTAPKLTTLKDRFETLSATLWPTRTNSGGASPTHDAKRRALSIPATMVGGNPNYAAGRSAEAYSFWSASTLLFRVVRVPEGGTANAQAWVKQPDAQGVGRVGFEWRVTPEGTFLDFIGQLAGYAPLGTTVTVPYNEHVHRWLAIEVTSAGHLVWYSSPNGLDFVVQRSLAAAEVPAWLTSRNDLAASFEAFRSAGTSSGFVYEFIVDDVNMNPEPAPTFTPVLTGGTTTFAANFAAADAVAAGYKNDSWQRQTATGGMGQVDNALLPWPPPIVDAPFGRSGRALPLRLPDAHRRYEVMPPTQYADGELWYVGFSFLFEADLDRVAEAGNFYQIVWQLHHAPDSGSPPIGFEVRSRRLCLAGGYGRPEPSTGLSAGGTYQWEHRINSYGEPEPNRWIDVVMGIGMWSAPNSGRIDVWLDGVQHVTNLVPASGTNIPGAGDLAYPKHGIYHDGGNRGGTVWFANYREGTSYAAVAPPSGVVGPYGDVIAEP